MDGGPESIIDVFDPEFQRDPHSAFRAARQRGRIVHDAFGHVILLNIDDFEAVGLDERFRGFQGQFQEMFGISDGPAYEWLDGQLLFLDPPEHTRIRKLVSRAFTPRRVAELAPRILATVDELLDAIIEAGEADFLSKFAAPLPLITICQLLGVPREDWPLLRSWGAHLLPNKPSEVPASDLAVAEFRDYLRELIADRRTRPRDDLVSALVDAGDDERLTTDELWNLLMTLLFAGHDTTMNLLCNSLYLLLTNPEQLAYLREDMTGRIDATVEECLRYEPPVSGNGRQAAADVEVNGIAFQAGQVIRLMPIAVNRDPIRFQNPDIFDIRRAPNRHVAFGMGIHFCLGAPLARQEARIAIPRLFERIKTISITSDEVHWAATRGRSLEALPIQVDRA
jgi:hypothetical protein